MNSNNEPLIEIENLSLRFGARQVLDGVNLAVRPGETVAILGPSGGGKSTLLRAVNGLNAFHAGRIRVNSTTLEPGRRSASGVALARVRRLMGMVFQDFRLFPHRTVLENLTEAPRYVLGEPRKAAEQRGLELLDRVGLADRADAYPRQLSGGQQQRVAIARALAMGPRGLLCDEITSALDPELKHEVLAVLENLKSDGLTLVIVTHEISFARRAADRVAMLVDGRILEEGPPSQVLDAPREERTRQFLSQVLD